MNLTAFRNKFILWFLQKTQKKIKYEGTHSENVGTFYNNYNDKFLQVYGEVIQAFRTNDLGTLLNYQIEEIGLEKHMRVLDAGCGVCGPAVYFADKVGCDIDALTISSVQADLARIKVDQTNLGNKIRVHLGDYHQVGEYFEKDTFDRIYFLESFGHSDNKEKLLHAAWEVLKPGGEIYIKDLFIRKINYPLLQKKIYQEIDKINTAYHYKVAELADFVDVSRRLGYVIAAIKTIDLGLDDFENLAISNEFQELTGIAQIKNWDNYIFPVDFFEVRLYKPEYDIKKGKHRYFLQNLFQIRENEIDPADLGF